VGTVNLKFIRQRRKQLKINQDEMAALLGFGRGNYSRYETGICSFKAEQLPQLCNILKCSITELYTDGIELKSRKERELLEAFRHINELYKEEEAE